MSEDIIIDRFEQKRFYLERFFVRRWGWFGKLFPFTITIAFLVAGYLSGLFTEPDIIYSPDNPIISYLFWAFFIPFTVYLMTWTDIAIKKTIKKANDLIKFDKEVQKNLINSLYGIPGIIVSILIALPFIIYDITGFGITDEGWLNDIAWYFANTDNSWYPRITETTNGIGFGSILWLVIWIVPWLFMGAFIWMFFSFIIFIRAKMEQTKWKDDIKVVVQEKQHKTLLTKSIFAFLPLSVFIAVKFVYQTFFIPWWSDTISMYIVFGIFLIGTIIAPTVIAKDIDDEKEEALALVEKMQHLRFHEVAKNIVEGKESNTDDMLKAVIVYLYTEEMHMELKKKTLDKHLINKMIVAAMVPILTYAVKFFIGPILAF
jgi:MFS family permease